MERIRKIKKINKRRKTRRTRIGTRRKNGEQKDGKKAKMDQGGGEEKIE